MGTGGFLRMGVSEGQCCASALILGGLEQSWPGGSSGSPAEPLEISCAQDSVTQLPSSVPE